MNMHRRHLAMAGALPCADGKFIQMHSGQPGRFQRAMELFGLDDRVPAVPPLEERNVKCSDEERQVLESGIPAALLTKTRDEWLRIFRKNDISAMEVDPPGVAMFDAQVQFSKLVADIDDPVLGAIKVVGPVLKYHQIPTGPLRPAPRLGEHNPELASGLWKTRLGDPSAASDPGASLKHPLQGVKIVDFGTYFAGPYASKLLADVGAEVIKVEALTGDILRPTSLAFRAAQRGKRSLALDLKSPKGLEIARQLIAWADIVTHNFRAGVAERLGVGFEDARKINPRVVYMHSTGFGSTGPRADEPCFAPLLSGVCGLLVQAAGEGNPPLQSVSNEDHHNGSLGAIGLLMALHYRDRTGKALSLESSLLGSTLFVTSELVMRADHTPIFRFNLDRDQTGLGPLCRIYRAADEKWIALVVASPKEWKALCEVRGLEGLSRNERFVDAVARSENGVALALELEAWFAAHPAADAVAELRARSVPAELIRPSTRESFFFDAENIRAGRVSILNHPQHGELRDPCGAIRFSDMQCVVQRTAPLIGEHSRDVLSMLGFSPSETEALRAEKVVTWPKEAVNG